MKIGPLHIPIYRLVIHLIVIIAFSFGFIRSFYHTHSSFHTFGNVTFVAVSHGGFIGGRITYNSVGKKSLVIAVPVMSEDASLFKVSFAHDRDGIVLLIGWFYLIITYALASITYAIIRVKRNHLSQRTDPT